MMWALCVVPVGLLWLATRVEPRYFWHFYFLAFVSALAWGWAVAMTTPIP
jgi:hypothetical protein